MKAENLGHFTMGNLQDAIWLRNRMGLQQALLEDPLLTGILAGRSVKGLSAKVKQESIAEAKAHAAQAHREGTLEEQARALIGPRGGMPHLRQDLVKLAALLRVPLEEKMTVAQIKECIKPMLDVLKANAPNPSASGAATVRGHDAQSRGGFGECPTTSSSKPRATSTSFLSRGGFTARHRDARDSSRPVDSRAMEAIGGGRSGFNGGRVSSAAGGPVWSFGDGGLDPRRCGESLGSMNSPWKIHQQLKKGQAQMISQAWDKHVRDRLKVSVGHQEVRQALVTEYEKEMQSFINDEIFVHCVDLTTSLRSAMGSAQGASSQKSRIDSARPLLSEVYTNTRRVMAEAARRGHRVGIPMSLENGFPARRSSGEGQGVGKEGEAVFPDVGFSVRAVQSAAEAQQKWLEP